MNHLENAILTRAQSFFNRYDDAPDSPYFILDPRILYRDAYQGLQESAKELGTIVDLSGVNKQKVMLAICDHMDIPFREDMLI